MASFHHYRDLYQKHWLRCYKTAWCAYQHPEHNNGTDNPRKHRTVSFAASPFFIPAFLPTKCGWDIFSFSGCGLFLRNGTDWQMGSTWTPSSNPFLQVHQVMDRVRSLSNQQNFLQGHLLLRYYIHNLGKVVKRHKSSCSVRSIHYMWDPVGSVYRHFLRSSS